MNVCFKNVTREVLLAYAKTFPATGAVFIWERDNLDEDLHPERLAEIYPAFIFRFEVSEDLSIKPV